MKSKKPAFRNNPDWIRLWADHLNGTAKPLSDRTISAHGGIPSCALCWDTGICHECRGYHPQYCTCQTGYCTCNAGLARRLAYVKSLKDYGLT